jgi:molybdenum cofactor cytidylyltransferase
MSNPPFDKIAVVLLAAGGSNRMGQPKQLLEYQGETMIGRSVRVALSAGIRPVLVVLGANAGYIEPAIATEKVHVVHNPDWPLGMSTSLRVGLEKALMLQPALQALLFMVVDQPFVTKELLLQIADKYLEKKPLIVAAEYEGTPGVPALIDRELFGELRKLTGDKGARTLFAKYGHRLLTVPFPKGHYDLDTPADYDQLLGED